MKNFIYPLLVFYLFSCSPKKNKETISVSTSNFSSTFQENKETIEIVNSSFQYFSADKMFRKKPVVLQIQQKKSIEKFSNLINSRLKVNPYNTNKNWSFETKAHELNVRNNTIITRFNAQGEIEDTYSLYNLETGKHLLDYTYEKLTVKIPETNFIRYIGFTSRANAKNILKNYDKDVVGKINYASENNSLQTILIKTKENVGKSSPNMDLVSLKEEAQLFDGSRLLYFWNLDKNYNKKDIDFAFVYTFFIGEEATESAILFEVKDDNILLENVKYDSNIFEIVIE